MDMLLEQEASRLQALHFYNILDTLPEQIFDDLTLLASQICDTPIALISFVDKDRQWFKSKVGLDATETARSLAFCDHSIRQSGTFIVPDALQHPDFMNNELVTGEAGIRFYAGAVLKSSDGSGLGTLCVIDQKPRTLSKDQLTSLNALARQVMQLLEFRKLEKEASKASILKSEFVAKLSHEIRVPLTALQGFVELAQEESDGDQRSHYLNIVRKNLNSLNHLVDEVLDLSKIEAGHLKVQREWFSLTRLLHDAHELFSLQAERKGLDFQLTMDAMPEYVYADVMKMRQIVRNLVMNAIKFTDSGFINIHLTREQAPDQTDEIVISVEDSGCGIPEEKVDLLFRQYSQVNSDTNPPSHGTGLGLSVSRKLAELLSGSLEFESSRSGTGSKFILRIPVTMRSALQGSAAATKTTDDPKNLTGRLLLVDDTPDNRLLLKHMLKKTDIEVTYAENGLDALQRTEHNAFDLVLMDIEMPVMNGLDAAVRMRAQGVKVPIIALTGHAMSDMHAKIMEAGFNDILTKPILQADLLKILAHHCSPY